MDWIRLVWIRVRWIGLEVDCSRVQQSETEQNRIDGKG